MIKVIPFQIWMKNMRLTITRGFQTSGSLTLEINFAQLTWFSLECE